MDSSAPHAQGLVPSHALEEDHLVPHEALPQGGVESSQPVCFVLQVQGVGAQSC